MKSDFEILDRNAKVDTCYGLETFCITKDDITALLDGKKLYTTINCDGYAITIKMAKIDVKQRLKDLFYSLLKKAR